MSISRDLKTTELLMTGESFAEQIEITIRTLVPILNRAFLMNKVFTDGEIKQLAREYSEKRLKLVCKMLDEADKETESSSAVNSDGAELMLADSKNV